MSVKRQYILPNCSLILEGLEDSDSENVDILDGQSPMSILINAECNFIRTNKTLSGGSVFLKNLSRTVSNYAQSFLSGLNHPHADSTEYPQVTIDQTDSHLHHLTLTPEKSAEGEKTEIDLTTIELFDLVDAIDQFHADRTTLPGMSLELKPVSRRYRKPEQPLAERLTPVVIGFTSLALAAGAFFVIPIPEVRSPESSPINNTIETQPIIPEDTSPNPENNSSETESIPEDSPE